MAGKERELMSKMDFTADQAPVSFLEASNSMRDFWRLNTGPNHHLQPPQAPTDHHMQEPDVHSGYTTYNQPELYYYSEPAYNSALLSAHATYTNFFNQQQQQQQQAPPEKQEYQVPHYSNNYHEMAPAPLVPNMNRDMQSLREGLAYKCPRSNDLLMAITKTAEATVQEHGTPEDDDDDDDPLPPRLIPLSELEQDQELQAAIIDHPFYPEMVVAHIKIFKIGAPKALRNKLDDITKKFQKFHVNTTRVGDDPSLDFFMRSYVDLLGNLCDDMEDPFNKFMQFKDATTKELEDICGYYVETGPDESDNYGYDISFGPMEGGLEAEELERMKEDQNTMYPYNDIDDSIIIDATLPDDELRKKLMQKYGRHIGGLKAEFNRVRKKGKLPAHARTILKDWFNRHSYWPYPSEVEKQYLQRICHLNLKQINNWFINERKRHWSCEGKCMHPNAKFYNSAAGHSGDNGNLE